MHERQHSQGILEGAPTLFLKNKRKWNPAFPVRVIYSLYERKNLNGELQTERGLE